MRRARSTWTLGAALAAVLAAVAVPGTNEAGAAGKGPAQGASARAGTKGAPVVLFQLGKADGLSAEFGLTKRLWPAYAEVYRGPVVFEVGKSPLSAWPYIHPSNDDRWAGGRPHTFTIRFTASRAEVGPLYLVIGVTDAMPRPPRVTVALNGRAAPPQRAPAGMAKGAFDPRTWWRPAAMVFRLPDGALRPGPNTLTIRCETGSWFCYDYVRLGTDPKPPALSGGPKPLLARALEGPLAGGAEVVFAARPPGVDGHWYANFSYYAEGPHRLTYRPGGKLYRLDLATGRLWALVDDPRGGVRDPQVAYDGRRILFSWRKGDSPNYHLYEIGADGTGLRQITDGPWDDIEPTYLPDGRILFVSSRCKRWVNCWLTQVGVLYLCDADGSNLRPVSSNNEHDNTPWPMPDGTVLYTRWEYVDRSQVHYHHLWTVNPDGTGQMVFFGNLHPGVVMIDAKPVPGTGEIISIFSPGHGRREHAGPVTLVDARAGPDAQPLARRVGAGADFRDPYPLSADLFLVARGADLVLMDRRGRTQVVFTLPEADRRAGLALHEPRPLRPRPRERVVPDRVDLSRPTGRLVLIDVYRGRNMAGVRRGEIKRLLVLETLPKPINFTGGMEPLSYGGTFTLERVLGTVPVAEDGSAYFEVPALRSVFFVALDENGLAVKRMQSFVTVQPGEVTGCVGCHERRETRADQRRYPAALRRRPDPVTPLAGVPDVLDFPRDIQPVLDRHCVRCHGYEKTDAGGPRAGGVILTGDRGPMFSHSYFTLSALQQLADGRNRPVSNYPPRALGSGGAPLMKKIAPDLFGLEPHHGVRVTGRERTLVRLWLDTGAPYPGTYAALGTGMIGGYAENRLDRSDTRWPEMKALAEVQRRRCLACHKGKTALPTSPSDNMGMPPWAIRYGDPRLRFSRHILYNLSRPEKSILLLAPLAEEAGGWGLCKKGEAPARVFTSTADPDYRTLLAAVRRTKAELDRIKRFDMAGFQPRPEYLREMKRYGVLPADFDPNTLVDPYALDRAYWRSLWYRVGPAKGEPAEKGGALARTAPLGEEGP